MIDLHLHTTASDGRSTPEELVAAARAAGCHTIAVTDHDTVAALGPARLAADAAGLTLVDGIEMTAVHETRDVHILGYFIDPAHPALATFLSAQRESRRDRVRAIGERLAAAGVPVDLSAALAVPADTGRAIGRPAVALALIAAGHARDVADAFNRYLSEGRPGYMPREGASTGEVVARIRDAGGVASLAHPGKLLKDEIIAPLAEAGLEAIEVFHPDHTDTDIARYRAMSERLALVPTGGSDYHGPGSGRTGGLGVVGLPAPFFEALVACAARRRSA